MYYILRKIFGALVAVLVLGTVGYVFVEKMNFPDALLSAVSVIATVGSPQNLSTAGKLLTTLIIVSSIGLAIAALARILNPQVQDEETLTDFSGPGSEGTIMKEVKVGKSFSGMKKQAILEKYGVVIIGIKHRGGFDVNVPLNAKFKTSDSVLVMGTPAALLRLEKKK